MLGPIVEPLKVICRLNANSLKILNCNNVAICMDSKQSVNNQKVSSYLCSAPRLPQKVR